MKRSMSWKIAWERKGKERKDKKEDSIEEKSPICVFHECIPLLLPKGVGIPNKDFRK